MVHVHTAKAAIEALVSDGRFDLVHLDHDLGNGVGNNGYEVAVFISTMSDSMVPLKIVIHSSNQLGAERMLAQLENSTDVQIVLFGIQWLVFLIGLARPFWTVFGHSGRFKQKHPKRDVLITYLI